VKALHASVAVALASAVILSGMYAAAATAATMLAASLATEETQSHSRSVEFSAMVDRDLARHRAQASERKSTTKRKYKP
jgi:hypothetical protein